MIHLTLTPMIKLAILATSAIVVAITVLVVVCVVGPHCWCHRKLFGGGGKKRSSQPRFRKYGAWYSYYGSGAEVDDDIRRQILIAAAASVEDEEDDVKKQKLKELQKKQKQSLAKAVPRKSSSWFIWWGKGNRRDQRRLSQDFDSEAATATYTTTSSDGGGGPFTAEAATAVGNNNINNNNHKTYFTISQQQQQQQAAATAATALKRKDSTYSSWSSSGAGRPPSPAGSMSIKSAFSALSITSRWRSGSADDGITPPSSPGNEKAKLTSVTLEFRWRLNNPPPPPTNSNGSSEPNSGKLGITVACCNDLPCRDYGVACDPFVQISVIRDRGRSLRRKARQSFAEIRTKSVRHSLNPVFNQTFTIDLQENDLKNVRLKVSAFDADRHTKTTEIGSTSILLKDIKELTSNQSEGKATTSAYLALRKQEFGEVLFGMSYLPTAQRMSFSIVKASNLKYEEVASSLDTFYPYVRILQLSSNGRIVKKKKTTVKRATKDPIFNETLNFELSPQQLESATFIILLSQRQKSIELQDMDTSSGVGEFRRPSPSPIPPIYGETRENSPYKTASAADPHTSSDPGAKLGKDVCLGRISVGKNVTGSKERAQWANVISTPRKVFSTWQTLH